MYIVGVEVIGNEETRWIWHKENAAYEEDVVRDFLDHRWISAGPVFDEVGLCGEIGWMWNKGESSIMWLLW